MVTDFVSNMARFALFQGVNDVSGYFIVFSSAADERIERHVFTDALVHVERMNVELDEDVDAATMD